MERYYRAAQTIHDHCWIHGSPNLPHLHIEKNIVSPAPLPTLLTGAAWNLPCLIDPVRSTGHQLFRIATKHQLTVIYSPKLPLSWCNWLPLRDDRAVMRTLTKLDLQCLGDLFHDGIVKTWDQVSAQVVGVTVLDAFQYFRFWKALRMILGNTMQEPDAMPSLTYLLQTQFPQRCITLLYMYFKPQEAHDRLKFQRDWEEELGVEITIAQWIWCFNKTKAILLNGRRRLLHFKYIHRTYYTPARLLRYGLRDNDHCIR